MRRDSRLTADITEDAHNMLRSLVKKHERGKGFFIEKMIRKFCSDDVPVDKPKVKRSKPKVYPSNLDEQFELLWCAKGKRGSKKKAREMYTSMMEGATDESCIDLVTLLVEHIESRVDEIGFKELHLTTYIKQERWES